MWSCRVGYVAALCAACLFYILYREPVGWYALAAVAAFPGLVTAASLLALRGLELSLLPPAAWSPRTAEAVVAVGLTNRARLPLPRVEADVIWENLLTGEAHSARIRFGASCDRQRWETGIVPGHCGVIRIRVRRVRVWDLAGLFPLRISAPQEESFTAAPAALDGQGAEARALDALARQREDPEADRSDLRDYRPGDPLRGVRWKLYPKWERLLLAERDKSAVRRVAVGFDFAEDPDALDRTLDRLYTLCHALGEQGVRYRILWADPEPCAWEAEGTEEDLRAFFRHALARKLPDGRARLREDPSLLAPLEDSCAFFFVGPERVEDATRAPLTGEGAR